ncbi:VOC family protein [Mycobacteroides abscessus]|uniref:VOC family protein n=1 Tax=Mycobacteroides abscessus TaxID=36809 RepID=UPI002104DE5B|nr:VOC family protein [Mycobacteroides abscessus]
MRLSLILLYVPPPVLDRAASFYGAVFDAEPVREQHGEKGPEHWSITCPATGLVMELYPATSRPHTATRLEFHGSDIDAAVTRLRDKAYALPERTRDGAGWWVSDPIGNTVVLLPEPTR